METRVISFSYPAEGISVRPAMIKYAELKGDRLEVTFDMKHKQVQRVLDNLLFHIDFEEEDGLFKLDVSDLRLTFYGKTSRDN